VGQRWVIKMHAGCDQVIVVTEAREGFVSVFAVVEDSGSSGSSLMMLDTYEQDRKQLSYVHHGMVQRSRTG